MNNYKISKYKTHINKQRENQKVSQVGRESKQS